VKLSFHGADRAVTGSCHLVECSSRRILIDCGLFQGSRDLVEENVAAFGFDPATIDYVLLTHAHLDHCGRLPLLAKRGFKGEVITTSASRERTRLVLVDAAHLQEEEARRRIRQCRRRGEEETPQPLYTVVDALNCLDRFGRTAEYGQPLQLADGLRATFLDAGHILGSASILLEVGDYGNARSILFSGDLGNADRPLLRPPHPPARADIVVMETTYGDRRHRSLADSIDELYGAISSTLARGGNVIIPTFALERAQEVIYVLHQGGWSAPGCRRPCRSSWIHRWRSRRPRYSSGISNISTPRRPACFAQGGIHCIWPTCASFARAPTLWLSTG
jgi:metallo-beta-lactamase family protein